MAYKMRTKADIGANKKTRAHKAIEWLLANHNEWFMKSARPRKTCPNCRALVPDRQIYIWGEYANARWRRVQDFCRACWPTVAKQLNDRAGPCGCTITLQARSGHGPLPEWLDLSLVNWTPIPTPQEICAQWSDAAYNQAFTESYIKKIIRDYVRPLLSNKR